METLILIDICNFFNVLAFSPIFVDFIFWCFVHRSEGAAENSCRLMGTWTSRWFFGPWNGSSWWQVSASIKLFSNLLCTNFQITCQGKSAQQQLPSSSDNIIDYRWWVGGRLGGWNLVCQKQKRNFSHFYSNRICYARVYLIGCLWSHSMMNFTGAL